MCFHISSYPALKSLQLKVITQLQPYFPTTAPLFAGDRILDLVEVGSGFEFCEELGDCLGLVEAAFFAG